MNNRDPSDSSDSPISSDEQRPFDAVAAAAELEASMQQADQQAAGEAGAGKYVEELEVEVLELTRIIGRKEAALAAAEERTDRANDEVEAAKRRLAREAEVELGRRRGEILLAFVDVLDDLDRALVSARATDRSLDVVGGVEMVHRRFAGTLERFGVRRMSARGQRFDPALHEAVSLVSVTDPEQDGQVIEVLRAGYTLDRADVDPEILRPATVVVGKRG